MSFTEDVTVKVMEKLAVTNELISRAAASRYATSFGNKMKSTAQSVMNNLPNYFDSTELAQHIFSKGRAAANRVTQPVPGGGMFQESAPLDTHTLKLMQRNDTNRAARGTDADISAPAHQAFNDFQQQTQNINSTAAGKAVGFANKAMPNSAPATNIGPMIPNTIGHVPHPSVG